MFKIRILHELYSDSLISLTESEGFTLEKITSLDELLIPPGNRLETLKGDRKGQYSIRINQQYRICFVWQQDRVSEVEIVDYH